MKYIALSTKHEMELCSIKSQNMLVARDISDRVALLKLAVTEGSGLSISQRNGA